MNNYRILIVEDDDTLSETLRFNFELNGYHAVVCNSAEKALAIDISSFSIILLDIMMGEISGIQMAKILKANAATQNIPIIFCTAKDAEADMLLGLEIGADDYIFKPYSIKNVLARVKAVLRRYENSHPAAPEHLVFEGVELDMNFKTCRVDGKDAKLVRKEFEVLSHLIRNRGRLVSREELLDKVWQDEAIVLDRTIDVNITRIRRKIAPYGKLIITKSGYGYGLL